MGFRPNPETRVGPFHKGQTRVAGFASEMHWNLSVRFCSKFSLFLQCLYEPLEKKITPRVSGEGPSRAFQAKPGNLGGPQL